jgi:predicted PurR-regulated permease PerM
VARTSSAKDISRILTLVAAVVVITALYFARVMLVPLALAVLFTFVLAPLVSAVERIRIPRFIAIFLVVGITVSGIGIMGWTVGNQLIDVTNQLPSYKTNIKEKIDAIRNPKNRRLDKAADAMKELGKEIAENPPVPSEPAPSSLKNPGSGKSAAQQQPKAVPVQVFQPVSHPLESLNSIITPLGSAIIVVVLTIFMLAGREDLRNRLIGLVGHGHLNVMTQALDDAGSRVSRYLVLQLVINACFGVVIGLGLYFIGIPNSMLWGVVAGLLRFLPYVGSPLAAVLPILLSLAIFPTWTGPVATIGLYLIVEILVANFLEPLIYGAHTGISSFAILFAAIFWALIWGPIGLLLSTPLTVCLVVLGRHVPALQFLNIMLGDQPVLTPEAHYYQRLLASDQAEAKQVLDDYLKTHPLEDLYDAVLIPALALAEQDRHHDDLEEITEQFICKSTKELLDELGDKSKDPATAEVQRAQSDLSALSAPKIRVEPPSHVTSVVCIPARDEADEIVGIMLSQVLERAGYHALAIPIGTTTEMLAQIKEADPDIVCISALPPFALLHARDLYKRVRSNVTNAKIIVGLWKFSGDPIKAAARFNIVGDDKLAITLAQAVLQVGVFQQIELVPEHAGATESK